MIKDIPSGLQDSVHDAYGLGGELWIVVVGHFYQLLADVGLYDGLHEGLIREIGKIAMDHLMIALDLHHIRIA